MSKEIPNPFEAIALRKNWLNSIDYDYDFDDDDDESMDESPLKATCLSYIPTTLVGSQLCPIHLDFTDDEEEF